MYSKMHYDEKIRPRARELIQLLRDKNEGKLPRGGPLACVKQATKEFLEKETDLTKEAVQQKITDHVKLQEERSLAQEERTPESFLE